MMIKKWMSIVWVLGMILSVQAEQPASPQSMVVVFKDTATVKTRDGKSAADKAGFKKIKSQRKLFKTTSKSKKDKSGEKGLSKAARNLDNMYVAELADGASLKDALAEMEASPLVEYAEPNYTVQPLATPNDEHFSHLWGLNNTGQVTRFYRDGFYETTNGTSDADMDWLELWESADFPTNEVLVAVIDTGVDYTHEDLTNQMWHNEAELNGLPGVDDDGNNFIDDIYGYDFLNTDSDPLDDHGHGTHCAGTIAAEANNGLGITGINPYAKIMALKFLGLEGGSSADGILCLRYAADNGAKILNNSWGGGGYSKAMQDAVDYAVSKGCVVVFAAGNSDTSMLSYPAALNGVIAVAATDADDVRAPFSNYGSWVDISAPGVGILSCRAKDTSTDPAYAERVVETNYIHFSGTSMACPNTVGALSLLYAKEPGHDPLAYAAMLEATADTNLYSLAGNSNVVGQLGAGRVNALQLLSQSNATAYVEAHWEGNVLSVAPESTNALVVRVGNWSVPLSNVVITVTNLTTGISLNTNQYLIGDLAAFETVLVPSNYFESVLTENAGSPQTLQVSLTHSGGELAVETVSLYVFYGDARELLVTDLDGNGTNEVVTTSAQMVLQYGADGKLDWFAEVADNQTQSISDFAIGDVDGDGLDEVVVLVSDHFFGSHEEATVVVLDHLGQFEPGFPLRSPAYEIKGVTLADLDEDGVLDILVTALENEAAAGVVSPHLWALKGDGTWLWNRLLSKTLAGIPSVADLDHDGWPEIIVPVKTLPSDSAIDLISRDGTDFAASIELPGTWNIYSDDQVAAGDLDDDGDLELIVSATETGADGHRVYAWHHDGSLVSGWPRTVPSDIHAIGPVHLADVDGDRDLEIFAVHRRDALYGWHHDGTAVSGFPMTTLTNISSDLFLEDVTGEGEPNWVFDESSVGLYVMNANGTFVSGYNPKADLSLSMTAICTMPPSANRIIAHVGPTGIEFIDTGFAYNTLPLAWPLERHDIQRTGACVDDTNPVYRCSFSAADSIGVSDLTAQFTASVWEFDPANSWYSWDFDNNGSVDYSAFGVRTASHDYTSTGDYTVSLTVSNAAGETYTRTRTDFIQVLSPVAADFISNVQTAEAPIQITFTDLSVNTPQRWEWDFNNDSVIDSTNANPSYSYTTAGTYTVSLTVYNDFGAGGASTSRATKASYVVLTNDADSSIKYVATDGLHIAPFKNWREAATNVQAAVDAAENEETVLVSNGTYRAAVDSIGVDVRKPIVIRSVNGPASTTIRGHSGERALWADSGAEISGFTLRDGSAGVYLTGHCLLTNCVVENNGSQYQTTGGGVVLIDGSRMVDCIVQSNNARYGAAVFVWNSSATAPVEIINSKILNNGLIAGTDGVGIDVYQESGSPYPVLVRNCLFAGNQADYSLIRCMVAMQVENCTFVDNTFTDTDSVLFRISFYGTRLYPYYFGDNHLLNSVISGNEGLSGLVDTVESGDTTTLNFSYCLTPFSPSGAGNITGDASFVDEAAGNYALGLSSPCINAGSNQAWMATGLDLAGESRIKQTTVDCGAYEAVGSGSVQIDSVSQTEGIPPMGVTFTGSASSSLGAIADYHWNFGDGTTTNGPALTTVAHTFTVEGTNTVVLTATDASGNSGWDSRTVRVDGTAPSVLSVSAIDGTHVQVVFDEDVSSATAGNIANYTLNRGASILSAAYNATLKDRVDLTVSILSTGLYELVTASVEDRVGNFMSAAQTNSFLSPTVTEGRIFFDFGSSSYLSTGNWNNVTSVDAGLKIADAVDSDGHMTGISLSLLTAFDATDNGTVSSAIYPTTAQRDVFTANTSDAQEEELRVDGLNTNKTYDFHFFSSTDWESETRYTVNGDVCYLIADNNTTNTASVLGVSPNAQGQVDVAMYYNWSNSIGWEATIGVMEIRYEPTAMPLISTNALSIPEGGTNTFGIELSIMPDTTVTVSVERVSGHSNLTVSSGAELIFTTHNWMTNQWVTLAAATDENWTNESAIIRCSLGDFYEELAVTSIDDDVDPSTVLPFTETFENNATNAGTLGALNGQHGWVAGAGAVVTNADAQSGSQSLSISSSTVSHGFAGAPTNIWIEFWSQPVRGEFPGEIASDASAVFYVKTNNQVVAYSNTTAMVLNTTVSNGWNKFGVECDYVSKVWNLELNDALVVSNFPFYGTPASFSAIEMIASESGPAFLDSINITDSLVGDDSDGDGLPDSWETIYYGGLSPDPLDLASNGVNTVLGCYIAGVDPTDPDAFFKLSNIRNILSWNSFSGRVYTIYWTSNLLSSFQALETNVSWTPGIFTDTTHSAEETGFYKIEVELE